LLPERTENREIRLGSASTSTRRSYSQPSARTDATFSACRSRSPCVWPGAVPQPRGRQHGSAQPGGPCWQSSCTALGSAAFTTGANSSQRNACRTLCRSRSLTNTGEGVLPAALAQWRSAWAGCIPHCSRQSFGPKTSWEQVSLSRFCTWLFFSSPANYCKPK